MNDLLVIAFSSEEKAEAVRQKILTMQKEYLIELGDAVVAVKGEDGSIKLNQLFNTTAIGGVSGAFWGALIGMVALLLGFTFSVSLQRFDTRSDAVIDEANAIGTAWLRAGLLPETVELPDHPWFIGVQFHPEYKSTVENPHTLFVSFVRASLN